MRSAYVAAEALVKRCLGNSHEVWNKMAHWSQMSAPRQSSYSMVRTLPRRSASLSDAPLGGESAPCLHTSVSESLQAVPDRLASWRVPGP